MELKKNDILVCVGRSALSKAILKATDGQYSHTAQVIELNGELFIFDAQEGGCMPRTIKQWEYDFDYDYVVFRHIQEYRDLSMWFMQFSGVKYDKKGLAVGLFKSLVKNIFRTNDTMKEKYRNNGLFWCSELTMKPYVKNPEQFSPQDVYEWLIDNANFEIIK